MGNDGRIGNLLKKTQCKGSNISQRKWKIHFSSRRWTNIIRWKISRTGNIHLDTGSPNSRRRRSKRFLGESEGSPPPLPQDSYLDAGEAINDFWSMSGNFKNRHHVEPRVKLYSPREESFPIPLKHIDVSRTTNTNLDVMQESRTDDYENIDGSRDLSDSWTGFTQFTSLEEKPPDGCMWSGRRLTRRQATSRPDHFMARVLNEIGKTQHVDGRTSRILSLSDLADAYVWLCWLVMSAEGGRRKHDPS